MYLNLARRVLAFEETFEGGAPETTAPNCTDGILSRHRLIKKVGFLKQVKPI